MNLSISNVAAEMASHAECSLEIIDSVNEVSESEWNSLVPGDYPFLRHEFLNALEQSGCVARVTGWVPQHIVIRNRAAKSRLLAAAPMYIKFHSRGEYIFDWAWADFFERHGIDFYPKLVLQTPFTPLQGPKILTAPESSADQLRKLLIEFGPNLVDSLNVNSINWLFVTEEESAALKQYGYMHRAGTIQFVWNNPGYTSMDDFLGTLSSRKRKKIRHERRSVIEQGIAVDAVDGSQLKPEHWRAFEIFYDSTVYKYFAYKYLSIDFFRMLGETMPDSIVLFLASMEGEFIGASFCLRGEDSLYGRYWGAIGEFPFLHFETCYYSAIEYCISNGISKYDAGTRGEHKLQRGFLAQLRHSGHYIRNEQFAPAISNHVHRESNAYLRYRDELNANSAYRRG